MLGKMASYEEELHLREVIRLARELVTFVDVAPEHTYKLLDDLVDTFKRLDEFRAKEGEAEYIEQKRSEDPDYVQ